MRTATDFCRGGTRRGLTILGLLFLTVAVELGRTAEVDAVQAPRRSSNAEGALATVPPALPSDSEHQARKNRYITIDTTTNGVQSVALQVALSSMKRCSGDLALTCSNDGDCTGAGTCDEHPDVCSEVGWVSTPFRNTCSPQYDCSEQWFANLSSTPVYRVWTEDIVHVTDCPIVPVASYEIRACESGPSDCSDPLVIATIAKPNVHYGDCVGPVDPTVGRYSPPDRVVDTIDVRAYLDAVSGNPWAPHTTWVDLHGISASICEPPFTNCIVPQQVLGVSDLQQIRFGLSGNTYTESPGQVDPGECPEAGGGSVAGCPSAICGDGNCDAGEDQCNCPQDCGTAPSNEVIASTCRDVGDNDCDGLADCTDPDCATDPLCAPSDYVIEWVPVDSTAASFEIDGNRIGVPADTQVTLQLKVSGWSTNPVGDQTLGAYNAAVDSSGYASGTGDPLFPVGSDTGMGFEGAFIALRVCGDIFDPSDFNPLIRCATAVDCPAHPTQTGCIERPDYVFYQLDNNPTVSTAMANFAWSAPSTTCQIDPGGGERFYGGTLLVEVPLGAAGAYTVGFDTDRTFLLDCEGALIPGGTTTPAMIFIGGLPPDPDPPGPDPSGPECFSDLDCIGEWTGAVCLAGRCYAPKNRYLSISATANGADQIAWRVEITDMKRCSDDLQLPCEIDVDCATTCVDHPLVGQNVGWIDSPYVAPAGDLQAGVAESPVFRVWTETALHLGDCEIVPVASYAIRACLPPDGVICGDALAIGSIPKPSGPLYWGDVVGHVDPEALRYTPPNGVVNLNDVQAMVLALEDHSVAPPATWLDLARTIPTGVIDGRDLLAIKEAFSGEPYPGDPSACSTGGRAAGTTSPTDAGPQEDPPTLSCRLFDITTREPLPVTSQGLYRVVPDQRVLMELYLEDTMENLESYQTKLALTRTAGDSGSVSVVCNEAVDMCTDTTETTGVEICAYHENAAEVPDFVFAANVLSVDGGTNCPPKLATATLYGGSSVPPEPPGIPGYLASYALDISSDAGNGVFRIAFEREEQAYDSASYLLRGTDTSHDDSIQFRPDPGVPCTELIVIGDCNNNSIPDDCEVDSRLTGNLCDQGFCTPGQCGTAENCDWQQNNLEPDECQPNTDVDPTIDACDLCQGFDDRLDDDGDTVPDDCDQCPGFNDLDDGDGDTVPDDCDNCLVDANPKVESDGTPALCAPPAGQFWQLDSDCDGFGDECDRCPGLDDTIDSDGDGVADGCDLCPGLNDTYDCNDNLRPDCLDIDQADGGPCNTGDCSPDCNGNDIPDECDIQGSPDGPTYCTDTCVGCPPSVQGERCETDCPSDGMPNGDGVPDSCHYGDPQPRPMAGNSLKACCTTDEDCIIAVCGPQKKCQGGPHANEECTDDSQCTDSVCAYCSTTVSCMDGVCYARKNRYVSFAPHTGDESVAIQIRLVSMMRCHTDFDFTDETCMTDSDCREGYFCDEAPVVNTAATSWWVGQPVSLFYEESCSPPCRREDYLARVEGDNAWDADQKRVWPAGLIHVGDCEIVPVAAYEIRTTTDGDVFGPPLVLGTIVKPGALDYGDVVGVVTGGKFTPPQGFVNVTDVQAQQITFQGGSRGTAPAHPMWVDLHGLDYGLAPNQVVNVSDLQVIQRGFIGDVTHTQSEEGRNPADCQITP